MDDFTPHIDNLQHNFRAGADGRYVKVTTVQYRIGPFGPFFYDFPEGQDTPSAITTYVQQKANELRVIPK